MKKNQELIVKGYRYSIYNYQCEIERNMITKELSMLLALSIPTKSIETISDWIMKGKDKEDITIVRRLSENRALFKTLIIDSIYKKSMTLKVAF